MLRRVYRLFLKQNNIIHLKLFMLILMSYTPHNNNNNNNNNNDLRPNGYLAITPPQQVVPNNISSHSSSLQKLSLHGRLSFDSDDNQRAAAKDFGNIYHFQPFAVLHPKSVSDISSTVKRIFEMGSASGLTVAARGHGHSLQGQAQAHHGVVVNMDSLKEQEIRVVVADYDGPFADVSGGDLWIDILHETLRYGLAPKSWTDYLYLTVGGTLSNAGISGQAFKHGPQISNVRRLEVVTGKGDVITCSENRNADLFNAVLGGLGQFGIITRARISLEPAPKMVKWIRVLYTEFSSFSKDQESLISSTSGHENSFDYMEGFVIINRTGLLNNWRSSFDPKDPIRAGQFTSDGKTLYCLEMALYFSPNNKDITNKKMDRLLSELSYVPSTLFVSEVTYLEFLNRVHISQVKLEAQGLWDVPHPWMNLFVPKSKIRKFAKGVFGNILKYSSNGPILIYPVNKSKWNDKTSLVTPNDADDVIYLVAFLSSAEPSSSGNEYGSLEQILTRNQQILAFCAKARLGMKQYLPHYGTREEWRGHFGPKWPVFVKRKSAYDPLAILAPGHRIFEKGHTALVTAGRDQKVHVPK